jgi:Zn-dependent protease
MWLMGGWTLGRVFDIPVRLHWTVLLLVLFLFPDLGWMTFPLLAVLLGSVLLHELGHAVVAQECRLRVDQILLSPLGGVAMIRGGDLESADEMRIAVAGPLVSLGLALAAGAGTAACAGMGWFDAAYYLALLVAVPNGSLFLFNLIPAFPMDGGRMLRATLSRSRGRVEATRIATRIGRGLAFLFGALALLVWHDLRLTVLAIFIYLLAGAEWRAVRLRQLLQNPGSPFGFPGSPDFDAWVVSPPPYAVPRPRALGWEIPAAARVVWRRFFSRG